MFQSNDWGIKFDHSFNNKIHCNNFIDNKEMVFFHCTWKNISNIQKNDFSNNYWGRLRILPYMIEGRMQIKQRTIKWFNIDWHPALKPFEINAGDTV